MITYFKSIFRFDAAYFICSLLFAIINILGHSFFTTGNAGAVFNRGTILSTAVACLGLLIVSYILCLIVSQAISEKDHSKVERDLALTANTKQSWDQSPRKVFLITALVTCLAWLPYIIAFFPGSLPHDGLRELHNYYGIIDWSNHHPVFTSWLTGFITDVGYRVTQSPYLAIFSYTIVQTVILSLTCSAIASSISKLLKSKVAIIVSLAFFCLTPLFGVWAQTMIKDVLYMCFFALFTMAIINVLTKVMSQKKARSVKKSSENLDTIGILEVKPQAVKIFDYLLLGSSALLTSLCRKEGIYIVAACLVLLVLCYIKYRRNIIAIGSVFVGVVLIVFSLNVILLPALNIRQGSAVESMSLPLNQLARTYVLHKDTLTPEQIDKIEDLWLGNDIASLYNPDSSDVLKGEAVFDRSRLNEFVDIYIEVGASHPKDYLTGAFASTYGYFYIGGPYHPNLPYITSIDQYLDKVYEVDYLPETAELRGGINSWLAAWIEYPILYLFMQPGAYTWCLLFLLVIALRRSATFWLEHLVLFMPFLLTIAVACLSPIDGNMRYVLSLVIALPLTFLWVSYVSTDSLKAIGKQRAVWYT